MQKAELIICPDREQKARDKIREDTEVIRFSFFSPEHRQENIIKFKDLEVNIVNEQGI